MSHSNPDWYESLQANPLKQKTFTDQLAQTIQNRTKLPVKLRGNKIYRISFISFAILCILGVTMVIREGDFFKTAKTHSGDSSIQQNSFVEANVVEQTQDEKNTTQGGRIPTNNSTAFPEKTDQQGKLISGAIDISKVPADEIFVPRSVHVPDAANTTNDSVLKESKIFASMTDNLLVLRTTYYSPSDVEIVFSQAPATMDEDKTIQSLKKAYKKEKVELTQINGHTAVYVDGEYRKVVHLITKDHFFTASTSNANGTIEDCKNILEQIQLKGE